MGAVVVADAGPCCRLTRRRRRPRRKRRCCSSTITRCCGPASRTSSTRSPTSQVVAEAANGVEAIEAFERHHPDVTLLDLRMPVMEGVEAVRQIRERDPRARVIVLTTYDTDDEISRALKAGAKAYVLKDISADLLIGCIRDVLAGKTYLAPAAAAKLAEGVTRVQLTPREMATLKADGRRQGEQGDRERARRSASGPSRRTSGICSRSSASPAAPKRSRSRRAAVSFACSRPAVVDLLECCVFVRIHAVRVHVRNGVDRRVPFFLSLWILHIRL